MRSEVTKLDGPRTFSRRAAIGGSFAIGLSLGSFGSLVRPAVAQEADYPELQLIATDYAFEMPGEATSGYNRLVLDNQGAEDHHAMFFRLNDDVTPEQFQEALMSGDLGATLAVTSVYGGPIVGPGQQASVIAWLDPGMYFVVCVIPDQMGVPHAAHGMVSMLQVSEGENASADPVADGTISLIEMAFDGLPAEVPAGSYTWEVVNNGTQLHEMAVLQLGEGMTADMLMAILGASEAGATPVAGDAAAGATPVVMGPPPFELIGGVAPMSPGATNYAELDLQPGEHVAICFVPDAETGMPHFMMGMIAGFNVT